jgi:hypothetical protein
VLLTASAVQPLKIDFSDETVGAEPKSFVSVVGVWRIEADGNNKVLVVDGRQWKEGQTSAGIADKARALYGDRYARGQGTNWSSAHGSVHNTRCAE